jgi:hypothetical protein
MADVPVKVIYATVQALLASGASVGSGSFISAGTLGSAEHSDYPAADFALTVDFGAAVAAGVSINLYRADMDIDAAGTGDAIVPSTTNKYIFLGVFPIPSGQSASAVYSLPDMPLAHKATYWIENNTAQNMQAGWKLAATPKTLGTS